MVVATRVVWLKGFADEDASGADSLFGQPRLAVACGVDKICTQTFRNEVKADDE